MRFCRSIGFTVAVVVIGVGIVACDGGSAATPATTTSTSTSTTVAIATTSVTTTMPVTTTTAAPETPTLVVPAGSPPTIDGVIEPDEWSDATVTSMDDGTELLWLHADGSLYVGVRGDALAAVDLTVFDGDRVRVLHSSAALGSALYLPNDDGSHRLDHGYVWCCRAGTGAGASDTLLAEEGWVANIGHVGETGHVEYRVVLGSGDLVAALARISLDDVVAFWPTDLPFEVRETLYGVPEDSEVFETEAWVRLALTG